MHIQLFVRQADDIDNAISVPLEVAPFSHIHDRHLSDEAVTDDLLAERTIIAPETSDLEAILHDGFGVVYLGAQKLSKHVWVTSKKSPDKSVRVEFHATTEAAPLRQTLWGFLGRRRCGRCKFFDHAEGLKWRHEKTTVFLDGTSLEMWDAVLRTTAHEHDQPAIADDDIGLCPRRESIVSRNTPACAEFAR